MRLAADKYDYLAPTHTYADRVYTTLRSLHAESGVDAVEFADRTARD